MKPLKKWGLLLFLLSKWLNLSVWRIAKAKPTDIIKIHDSQKQLLILEQNLKEEEDVNAAINVDMLKFASFEKIKSTAEKELGMVYPSSESTISIDMSKEYFSHIKQEESTKGGLLQKIMAAFN